MSRVGRLLGALVTGAAAAFVLVACGGSSEGTVVAKTGQGAYDYACQAGGSVTGPVAVPVWGACSVPECWQLVVRDSDGGKISGAQAFVRMLGMWVSAAVFYIGYIWIFIDARRRGWHDLIAGTVVIERANPPR